MLVFLLRPAGIGLTSGGRLRLRSAGRGFVRWLGPGSWSCRALIVNTSAGTASTRLARRLAADLPEATVIETDAGDLSARLRLAAASARILGVAGATARSAPRPRSLESDSGDTRPV